jgi:tetratricopeptide (TPR) repeat protein
MSAKSTKDIGKVISSIQKVLLYVFVAVLPISLLPFPWDLTEKGMTIVILFFTLLIVGAELVKIIWSGKILFLKKDIDLIIFILFISLILTTIFAQDTNLSIFGFNYRLSAGLLGIGSILLVTFISRSFITTKQDFLNTLNAFFVGSILTSLLSLVSFFGGNIFNVISRIGVPNKEGLPNLGTPSVLVLYNSIAIFLGYLSLNMYRVDNEEMDASWFSVVTIFVNFLSLVLFSMASKAFIIAAIFVFIWILVLIIMFFKDKKTSWKKKINQAFLPVLILFFIGLLQIKPIQNLMIGDRNILSSLSLSLDSSWRITSQTLMDSLKNGVFGLGLDAFGVAFTNLKSPDLININFSSAYNEILTSLTNSGLLWLVIWGLMGWYILKDLINDIKEYKGNFKIIVLFDTLLFFVYLSSFITTYTAILRFVFFLLISLGMVLRSVYERQDVDNLLLKMWTMGTGNKRQGKFSVITFFLTIIVSIALFLGVFYLGRITLSSIYLMRAESYIQKESEKLGDRQPTSEEEKEITNNLYRWYSKAISYDENNPITNRKASLVIVDRIRILMEEYKNEENEEKLNDIVDLRSKAFEYSRDAVNLSPSLYSSYDNRARVYLGIINLGYTEYIRDAISVINKAIEMNSLDYKNYYNKAQLYYLLQEYELALEASTQALSIKGDYVPALILSSSVNGVQGKTEVQLSYLEAAKAVLEANELEDIQTYKDIVEQIKIVKNKSEDSQTEGEIKSENNEDVLETEQ